MRYCHPLMRNQLSRLHATILPYLAHCSVVAVLLHKSLFLKDKVPTVVPSSLPNQSEPPQQPQVFNYASLAKFSRRSTALEAESRMPFLQGLCEDVQSEYTSHKSSGMMFLLAVIKFVMQQSNADCSRILVLLPLSPISSLCSLRSYKTRHWLV